MIPKRFQILILAVCSLLIIFLNDTKAEQNLKVPILVDWPESAMAEAWPVTCGMPFRNGVCKDSSKLSVIDESGKPIDAQIMMTGAWNDASVRWALIDFRAWRGKQYFVVSSGKPLKAAAKDDIRIATGPDRLTITNGVFQYVFSKGSACFNDVALDLNGNNQFEESERLLAGCGDAFYVVDNQARTGTLKAGDIRVELEGRRHTVVRVEGEYLDSKGDRIAGGVVYFHFFAGSPQIRIDHKFIVTEDTNKLWFRDIGIRLALKLTDDSTASFNDNWAKPGSTFTQPVSGEQKLNMLQSDYPHFGSESSRFEIYSDSGGKQKDLKSGTACGDWCDVSDQRWGLSAQVPGFAEQFPKAFSIAKDSLVVHLWASDGRKDLDFRTESIMRDYFGHDWIPKDHKSMKLVSAGQGTSKIHEVWLVPHKGQFDAANRSNLSATRNPIYSTVDPNWSTAT